MTQTPDSTISAVLPLELDGVSYDVGTTRIVDGLSAVIEPGSRTIILGANGAGKSVMLRLCHGLIRPSAGSVRWHGSDSGHAGRHQAMVFQRPVLLRRSAAANIAYALALRGVRGAERRRRTAEALEWTGLAGLAARPARVLSGGEQQRLALARAWALRPEVLFLDEPSASLDPAATHAIENAIAAIVADGTKIIMTTHDLGQARRLADDILFLHDGRLIEHAAADTFFAGPQRPEAQAFLDGRLWLNHATES
jgi:tungstate transport system ATP-binding protein